MPEDHETRRGVTDEVTAPGELLADRYQVGDLIGRGGMAHVHEGFDARLGRKVAIKLLKPSLANDPSFRTRFRQEAQAAARMAHPTIVRVYDAGEQTVRDPGTGQEIQLPFIVMERVDGTLLRDLAGKGPMPAAEAGRIVDGILTALEYSHRAGVVHRDIKPGNVMITRSGQVKVMDFGIARAIADSSATIAQTSAILGTAQYFSPEQARGEAVDARSDLYSTGVVLYELLTGRPPFRGDGPVAVAYQHVSETPAPPAGVAPGISPALNAVVMRSLAKDRAERYQSAAEFRDDLQTALSGKVPDARGAGDEATALFGVDPRTVASQETLRRLAEADDRPVPRTQTRPPVAWIWGGAALMIVVVAAALLWVFNLSAVPLVDEDAAVDVPDVVGMVFDEGGEQTLLDADLRVDDVTRASDEPVGTIVETVPPAGTTVSPGQTVRVIVSSGPEQLSLRSLAYMSEQDAVEAIAEAGLTYGQTRHDYSPDIPRGQVIGALVNGETVTGSVRLPEGTTIDLLVSNGLVNVPDVTGQSVSDAQDTLLDDYQLQVRISPDSSCSGQTVRSQSIIGEQPQRSTITLAYCSG